MFNEAAPWLAFNLQQNSGLFSKRTVKKIFSYRSLILRKKTNANRELADVPTAELMDGLDGFDLYLEAVMFQKMEKTFSDCPMTFEQAMNALEWGDANANLLREIVADFPEEGDQYVLNQVKETFCPDHEFALFAAIKCLRQEMGHYPFPWED